MGPGYLGVWVSGCLGTRIDKECGSIEKRLGAATEQRGGWVVEIFGFRGSRGGGEGGLGKIESERGGLLD